MATETYVVKSYWFGDDIDARYGSEMRVERVVVGSKAYAKQIAEEIKAELAADRGFCYIDFDGVEASVEGAE